MHSQVRHPGGRADPGVQVALGLELAVALLDQAAGDAELGGQLAGGREALADPQPAGADGVPQAALELGTQRFGPGPVQWQEELRAQTGPFDGHGIGP